MMKQLAAAATLLLLAAVCAVADVAASNPAAEAVVLKDFQALSTGDLEGLVAVFAPEIQMYRLPTEAHTLTGPRSEKIRNRDELRVAFVQAFATMPLARHDVLGMVSLGDLVAVRVAIQAPDNTPADHAFTVFRVRDGLIEAIWHVATEADATLQSGATAQAVIQQRMEAGNRRDADAFLALYSPDAKHFHFRHDPERLGGGPSQRVTDQASRERVFRALFAEPGPMQVSLVDSTALGEWVAVRSQVTRADGTVHDDLSIYRVRDGLITDDWRVAEQARP